MNDFISHHISIGPSLDYYRFQIKQTECKFCGYRELDQLPIEFYEHDGGWWLTDFTKKQWLYITCPKCGYEWALWKLGVPR